MSSYNKKKNLLRSPDEYNRYYGGFRGVDFSSDHTQVHDQRLAYAINMYKDYRNGEGNSVETIPGFRRRFTDPKGQKINGIHEFEHTKSGGTRDRDIIVHAGERIYYWEDLDLTANTVVKEQIVLSVPDDYDGKKDIKYGPWNRTCESIKSVEVGDTFYNSGWTLGKETNAEGKQEQYITFEGSTYGKYGNQSAVINFVETTVEPWEGLTFNNAESHSFTFNNRLYILDGENYWVYDGSTFAKVSKSKYIYTPTTYKGIGLGEKAPMKAEDFEKIEYEQKNLLCEYYKHSYVADGVEKVDGETTTYEGTSIYPLYDTDRVTDVYRYDTKLKAYTDDQTPYDYKYDDKALTITFKTPPLAPTDASFKGKYDETYPGVVIVYAKDNTKKTADESAISKCTILASFDKRVFLSGNPDYPRRIWFCGINNNTGYEDPTYFGVLDYVEDGVENAPVTGLIPVADTLAALKNHVKQDGTIYFHTRMETGSHVAPVTYRAEQGLSGYGCLGACVNFLDDPIFISKLGVEGIGQLSVRLERAVEHRSSLIDSKFVNLLEKHGYKARLAEWGGYLVVLVGDCIFLADSRQMYTSDLGTPQYEWYYLEGIGIYDGQVKEYYYGAAMYNEYPDEVTKNGVTYPFALGDHIYDTVLGKSEDLRYSPVEYEKTEDAPFEYEYKKDDQDYKCYIVIRDTWDGTTYNEQGNPVIITKAIPCIDEGSYTGGTLKYPTCIVNIDDNLFFGTENGVVCSFNFDLRETNDGSIDPSHYNFDHRTIYCGIATKMDNCGIPHLAKSTIKKSTVIKMKAMRAATAKLRVRTNKDGYKSVARLNSRIFSFDDLDFSDFTFVSQDQTIFALKEKEKHWVEKQHWIYSDEYQRPFSVYYIAYRYKVSGRIKD